LPSTIHSEPAAAIIPFDAKQDKYFNALVNIIGANWSVPAKPTWHGYGQSLILRRNGQVAAKVKNDLGNEVIYADLTVGK